MARYTAIYISIFMFALVTGCATTDGVGRYRVATIGNAKRTVEAVVISSEPALVQGGTTGVGSFVGGTTGGIIAENNSNNAGIIIAGIIGGMIVGNALEHSANVHEATEYVIQTSTDAILTVVQVNKGNQPLEIGDKTLLIYGFPSRLIKDPR